MKPGEQRTDIINLARFLAQRPNSAAVLVRKVIKRFRDGSGRYSEAENIRWVEAHTTPSAVLAQRVDPGLWTDALAFGEATRARAKPILAEVPFDMGAGGDYEFLYWLTRHLKPDTIVETGVSAGWTSQAFLSAIARNGHGNLASSDFPYFRVRDPERYIGIIVDPAVRSPWTLRTDGDEKALPDLLRGKIDIFHYDSDKSFSGRNYAVTMAMKHRAPGGLVLVDDILNDSWFREFVERERLPFTVLEGRCGLIDPSRRLISG